MSPFFVIGNPRSGTSLLRLMLNSHPHICVPPECGYIEWWYEKYLAWNKNDSTNKKKVDEYVNDILSSKKMETWRMEINKLRENILFHQPNNYADLSAVVCLTFAQSKNKPALKKWGDKNNYYIQICSKLHLIFPEARFILIVRDGRDVACSYKAVNKLKTISRYKPNLPDNINEIATKWLINNQNILKFFDTLPVFQKHILKYEALISDPESELKSICKHIGIDFSKEMLNYFLNNRKNYEEPVELIDWKIKTMEKPDASNSGKYKNELLPEEIENFNSIGGVMLKYFGYEI
jgi:hypothetical protein